MYPALRPGPSMGAQETMQNVKYVQDEDYDVEAHSMKVQIHSEFGGQLPVMLERLEQLSQRIASDEGIEGDTQES